MYWMYQTTWRTDKEVFPIALCSAVDVILRNGVHDFFSLRVCERLATDS